MSFILHTQRTCIGGNVFMRSEHPALQSSVSSLLKEKYNVDVFQDFRTLENGDTVCNTYIYPFTTLASVSGFMVKVFADSDSEYRQAFGTTIEDWYQNASNVYFSETSAVEVSDDAPIVDSLASGSYTTVSKSLIP